MLESAGRRLRTWTFAWPHGLNSILLGYLGADLRFPGIVIELLTDTNAFSRYPLAWVTSAAVSADSQSLSHLSASSTRPALEAFVDPLVAFTQTIVYPIDEGLIGLAACPRHCAIAVHLLLLAQPIAKAVSRVAAKLNIRAAAGHVGGDRHGARHAGLGDDALPAHGSAR